MKTNQKISTNELRFEFKGVMAALKRGQRLTLTYRNKPLAIISPFVETAEIVDATDSFYQLGSIAEPLDTLTNEELDRKIYDI